jgi:hypothetical protein
MSQKCNNFIDITKTMANRVQRKRCLVYSGSNALPPQVQFMGRQRTVQVDTLPTNIQAHLKAMHPSIVLSNVLEVASVTFKGLKVRPKLYYVIEVDEGVPVFWLAHRVFIVTGEVVVLGKLLRPICFSSHLHAYEIPADVPSQYSCLTAEKLRPFHVAHAYSCQGKKYLKLRCAVI